MIAALTKNDSAQMQAVKVIRPHSKNLIVNVFRLLM
jgi:hypothetical protein